MSSELLQLAKQLEGKDYKSAARIVQGLAESLEETGLIPRSLTEEDIFCKTDLETIKILKNIRFEGPYVGLAHLYLEKSRWRGSKEVLRNLEETEEDIEQRGKESLYHLCLPRRIIYVLRRGDVTEISMVRNYFGLEENERYIRNIGPKSEKIIRESLKEFDDLLREFTTRSKLK